MICSAVSEETPISRIFAGKNVPKKADCEDEHPRKTELCKN